MVFDQNLEGRLLLLINESQRRWLVTKRLFSMNVQISLLCKKIKFLWPSIILNRETNNTENKRSGIKLLAN